MGLPSGLFPSGFPTKTSYSFLVPSMHATCPDHRTVFDLFTVIITGKVYRLWSSSLSSSLQPPVTSVLSSVLAFVHVYSDLCRE
jgi:hypothetical protein